MFRQSEAAVQIGQVAEVVAVKEKKVVAVVAIKGKKSNDFGFLFCIVLRKGVF